jgi:hypothetical protein
VTAAYQAVTTAPVAVVGRRVVTSSPPGRAGVVERWEPLGSGLCDTLVAHDDDRDPGRCWYELRSLRALDGAALPDRREYADRAREEQMAALRVIAAMGLAREPDPLLPDWLALAVAVESQRIRDIPLDAVAAEMAEARRMMRERSEAILYRMPGTAAAAAALARAVACLSIAPGGVRVFGQRHLTTHPQAAALGWYDQCEAGGRNDWPWEPVARPLRDDPLRVDPDEAARAVSSWAETLLAGLAGEYAEHRAQVGGPPEPGPDEDPDPKPEPRGRGRGRSPTYNPRDYRAWRGPEGEDLRGSRRSGGPSP